MLDTSSRSADNDDHEVFRDMVRRLFDRDLIPKLERYERDGIVDREF